MKLFELNENYECEVIQDTVLLIPQFAKLFELKYNKQKGDHDGRLRKRAKSELTYMYLMYAYDSEFRELDEEERRVEALYAAGFNEDYTISEELEEACEMFIKTQETRSLRLLKAAHSAIDKTKSFLNEINYSDTLASGALKYDPNKVFNVIAGLPKVLTSLEKLEEQVKLNQQGDAKVRGSQEQGWLN